MKTPYVSVLLSALFLCVALPGQDVASPPPAATAASSAPTPGSIWREMMATPKPAGTPREVWQAGAELRRQTNEKLLKFYDENPNAPARWEAVSLMRSMPLGASTFIQSFRPEFDRNPNAKNVIVDEKAEAAWKGKLTKLGCAMAAAPDVPLSGALRRELEEGLRQAVTEFAQGRFAGSIIGLRFRIEDFAARFPDANSAALAERYVSALGKNVPGLSVQPVWQRFAESPNPAFAQTAKLYTHGGRIDLPAFTAVDGREVDLAKMRGKVVLIDFWSTYCGPCVAAMPQLKALYDRYHARGFEIIGIALQNADERQKLLDFVQKHDMPWPEYFDGKRWQSEPAVRNKIMSTPTAYLVDQAGTVVAYGTLFNQLHPPEIAQKLGELIPDAAGK